MRLRGTTDRPFPAADARLENPLINVSRLGIMEVEAGHGIAVVTAILKLVAGKRPALSSANQHDGRAATHWYRPRLKQ
jgi:hypothetical protein